MRFALKDFSGAVSDLRGIWANGSATLITPTSTGGGDGGDDAARVAGEKTAERVAPGGMGERALDTLDCSLGRALAEGRLGNTASREVSQGTKGSNDTARDQHFW